MISHKLKRNLDFCNLNLSMEAYRSLAIAYLYFYKY